jgi:ribosome biogenesis GTPase
MRGIITKALSGFYYVSAEGQTYACRARGKFRLDGVSPLVGDEVEIAPEGDRGALTHIYPRRNHFIRPAVANVDVLVILAAGAIPVTDPFLIDRVAAIAERAGCEVLVCINKTDLDPGDGLFDIYSKTGYRVVRTSAETLEGREELLACIAGKTAAFTGNSGVGKSSILNILAPELAIAVGDVSEKLGRGRHTTRHVELFALPAAPSSRTRRALPPSISSAWSPSSRTSCPGCSGNSGPFSTSAVSTTAPIARSRAAPFWRLSTAA